MLFMDSPLHVLSIQIQIKTFMCSKVLKNQIFIFRKIEYLSFSVTSVIHDGRKFQCKHCDYQTDGKSSLTNHKQSFHEGIIYEYGDGPCKYRAIRKSSLTLLTPPHNILLPCHVSICCKTRPGICFYPSLSPGYFLSSNGWPGDGCGSLSRCHQSPKLEPPKKTKFHDFVPP